MRLAGGTEGHWVIPLSVRVGQGKQGETRKAWYSGHFVIENGDVMLQVATLTEISPPTVLRKPVPMTRFRGDPGGGAGAGGTPAEAPGPQGLKIHGLWWVCARQVLDPPWLPVRSEFWQLPGGPDRDFLLRHVSAKLASCLRNWGGRLELGREQKGMVELAFLIPVPLQDSLDYMGLWQPIRQRCRCPSILWSPPNLVSSRTPSPADWSRVAYHASQLPSWFKAHCFWSLLIWEEGTLWHRLQFSLQERFLPAVSSRFGLPVRPGAPRVNYEGANGAGSGVKKKNGPDNGALDA